MMKLITQKHTILLAVLCVGLSACGWQLRGGQALAQKGLLTQAEPINVNLNFTKRNPSLFEIFNNLSGINNVTFTPSASQILTIHNVDIDKRHLAVTETGVAAQFLLTVTLSYSVSKSTKTTPSQTYTLSSRRDYDFDATQIIAKKQEEQTLLNELYEELAHQVLLHTRVLVKDTNK